MPALSGPALRPQPDSPGRTHLSQVRGSGSRAATRSRLAEPGPRRQEGRPPARSSGSSGGDGRRRGAVWLPLALPPPGGGGGAEALGSLQAGTERPPQRTWEEGTASRRVHRAIALPRRTRRGPAVSSPLCIWGLWGCGDGEQVVGFASASSQTACAMRVGLEQKARAWKGEDFSEPLKNLPHPVFRLASVVHSASLLRWDGDGFPRPTLPTLPTWRGAGREDGRRETSGWSFQPPDSGGHSPRDLCAPCTAGSLCLHVEHPPGPSAL